MRILVTGGAGYIGSVFIRILVSGGHAVRCLDQQATDLSALLRLTEEERSRCDFLIGDIRDPNALKAAVDNMDAVIHLAAIVGSPACDANPQAARSINVDGTRAVAETTPRNLPLIYLSTCSVYGRVSNGVCCETDSVCPLTLYGETKRLSEKIVIDREGVALRATTAYGGSPRFRWDLIIHTFIRRALTTGRLRLFEPHAIRPFIHIEDIASALVFTIEHFGVMAGKIYNIGSDDGTLTKLDLAQRIGALTGLEIEIDEVGRDPDGRHYRVAFNQIQQVGYRTSRPFDAGLKETVDWIRALIWQQEHAL
jgi:nucleoside-diphosphate-sugar epimerase